MENLLALLFPTLFTFIILIFIISKKRAKKSSISNPAILLPPGPWKLPFIGNIHQLISSDLPHRRLRNLANKYGPLMHLRLGEVPHIFVSSPDIAKQVMKTHDANFAYRPFLLLGSRYYGIDIVFAPYGGYWRMLRKICSEELLSPKRVQSFRSIREGEVSNLIGDIIFSCSDSSGFNFGKKISSMIYAITARAAFGKKCKDQEMFVSLVEESLKLASGFSLCELYPSRKWLHWIGDIRPQLEKIQKKVDKVYEDIIIEYKADKASKILENNETAGCLLDVILNLQESGELPYPLEMDNIKALIQDIFIAGSETSSTTIEWAMSEMVKNPRIMEKAQSEVRAVFGSQRNVDESKIHELKYLKMVIKETLRFHPPGPFVVPREAKESCIINGHYIPAKARVIVSSFAIGRDPMYWTEPERFYPERFAESSLDFKGTNFEFIPFGSGRRICPGILFAIADIELPLAQLLFHFDWKLPNGIDHESLDMSESFGMTVRRKEDLFLIPVPYNNNI